MRDGWIRTATGNVEITVADTAKNSERIMARIREAEEAGVNLLVLPELCVTGYTCGDLFFSDALLGGARRAAEEIVKSTSGRYPVVVFGLPLRVRGKLYNCAAVACDGKLLGIVPKTFLPNYGEFYEKRQFSSGAGLVNMTVPFGDGEVPFGTDLLFAHSELENYVVGVELCEDLWAPAPPSEALCMGGATMIANPSASDELIGKTGYRRLLVTSTSARLICGYVYANAAPSESTQDMVFSAHHLIAENGRILAESLPFEEKSLTVTEIDTAHLAYDRHRNTTFSTGGNLRRITFRQEIRTLSVSVGIEKNPFVPPADEKLRERAEEILRIQSHGLAKRLEHTHAAGAVIGISGGLDSTLALLVAVRAMDILGRPHKDILAVTMPCFGTTKRTKSNAVKLCEELGTTLRTVDITAAVRCHFADIGQDDKTYDVTFENSQARERTQVLMDIANKENALVIGTGDLSELALGWATYNGDHMSMYGVNASVPKTLVRYIVRYEAGNCPKPLSDVLYDILDTPVSPELLPVDKDGNMTQKTEDLVGPYELHDFFLYHTLRYGSTPGKIYRLANLAFADEYSKDTILHWLRVFTRRFFSQQFKRSCMPDSPKVGSVTLSPRGDWRMPSDASSAVWLEEIDRL